MEKEFQIPSNIPVIDKEEDYVKLSDVYIVEKQPVKEQKPSVTPGISISERTVEGYTIPDNIEVVSYNENVEDLEIPPMDLNKPEPDEEEFDIWKDVQEEFDSTEFLTEDSTGDVIIDEEKLFIWLKQKLSSVTFCETYLTDKLDGDNGVLQENSTLVLQSDKGSRFFLNKSGQYHRLDGPAIEWNFGAKEFFKNGIRHRIGGAAYEYKDEKQYWFEGKQYNENEYWEVSKEITSLK